MKACGLFTEVDVKVSFSSVGKWSVGGHFQSTPLGALHLSGNSVLGGRRYNYYIVS